MVKKSTKKKVVKKSAKKKTAKKTTKKKVVKKAAKEKVTSSRRGSLPTKEDTGVNVTKNSDIDVMSITSLHILTGKGKETIRQRIAILPPAYMGNGVNPARYYDPKKALPLIYERDFLDRNVDPDEGSPEGKKNDPKHRKEMAQAQKAEIELGELKKEIVRVDEITEQIHDEYALVRQRLLSIPGRIAKKILLAENEDEALQMLKDEVNGALKELNADSEDKLKVLSEEK